jgi:hypothetical protein
MALKIMDASSYLELNLKECGREICLPDKEFTYTPKSYHLFHYVASGKEPWCMADKTYHLHRGDLFYFAPHDLPHYTPDHDDPWSYLWLGFDGTNAKAFLSLAGLSSENPVFMTKTIATRNSSMRFITATSPKASSISIALDRLMPCSVY